MSPGVKESAIFADFDQECLKNADQLLRTILNSLWEAAMFRTGIAVPY
jgi:hypothetical protein